jgi:CheY-like chemotaxis protein
MSDETLTVLLADDEPLALRRLRRLTSEVEGVRIVGTATDGDEALALARETAAQVVVIDIKMPGRDGVSVARALAGPDGPVVIFATAFDRYAIQAFDLAAVDYLLKPFDGARVAEALARARAQIRARDAEQRIGELRAIVRDLRAEGPGAPPATSRPSCGSRAGAGLSGCWCATSTGSRPSATMSACMWARAAIWFGTRSEAWSSGWTRRPSCASIARRWCSVTGWCNWRPRPGGGLTAVLSTGARPSIGRSHAADVRRLFRRSSARTQAS